MGSTWLRSVLMSSLVLQSVAESSNCQQMTLDFIIKESDPEVAAVEGDIVADLGKIGITVNTRVLSAAEYIEAETSGDYNMMFTRTWGAPYDPHSYMFSWAVPAHVEYSAIGNMEAPLTRESLLQSIGDVQTEIDATKRQTKWRDIHQSVHSQAIFAPLWGTRIPYVLNRRFSGFTLPTQTYAYPLNSVKIISGSTNVTVAPGAGGSLFKSVGPINPHQYFPNQLFAQQWVYEGLVGYGQDGEIVPVLATSWETEDIPSGGSLYSFTLRENVKFHDGSAWNCSVAKLNFDHVLSPTVKQRHQWFGATSQLISWTCDSDGKFILRTKEKYYPLLQELTYIRPLTFAAASAFAKGVTSDPDTHNSCETGDFGSKWIHLEENITCAGLSAPLGTGPFKVAKQETNADGIDTTAIFQRHDDYWGAATDIKFIHLKYYDSQKDVEDALLNGQLDMALGIGPLAASTVQKLKFYNSDKVDVRHSGVMQHALMIMNTNAEHTRDIETRKAIIAAIDKAKFLEKEFAGLEQPVSQLLPYDAPYCNVELSPSWSFDIEKAQLINCPSLADEEGDIPIWGTALIIVFAALFMAAVVFLIIMYRREKQGKPVFTKLEEQPRV